MYELRNLQKRDEWWDAKHALRWLYRRLSTNQTPTKGYNGRNGEKGVEFDFAIHRCITEIDE
jgi:hypothetical protein